jgi:hypothetical protein
MIRGPGFQANRRGIDSSSTIRARPQAPLPLGRDRAGVYSHEHLPDRPGPTGGGGRFAAHHGAHALRPPPGVDTVPRPRRRAGPSRAGGRDGARRGRWPSPAGLGRTLGLRVLPRAPPWPTTRGPRDDAARLVPRRRGARAVGAPQPRPARAAKSSDSRPRGAGSGALDEFCPVFAGVRDLGSPVSRRFFRDAGRPARHASRVLLVRDRDGRAVGAAVCLFFGTRSWSRGCPRCGRTFALCPNFVLAARKSSGSGFAGYRDARSRPLVKKRGHVRVQAPVGGSAPSAPVALRGYQARRAALGRP